MCAGGQGEVIYCVGSRDRLTEAGESARLPLGRNRLRPRCVEVVDAGDWQAGEAVGRQMRVVDDAAGADDDDRPGRARPGPALPQRLDFDAQGSLLNRRRRSFLYELLFHIRASEATLIYQRP